MGIKANTKLNKKTEESHLSLTNVETNLLGLQNDNLQNAYVALKYIDDRYQCFSEWDKSELKAFTEFCKKISQMTWNQIYQSAGQLGKKTGLGYTIHKDINKLPKSPILNQISEDITFFELRVTEKARVHGFRAKSTFFLVWLDRDHQICPM